MEPIVIIWAVSAFLLAGTIKGVSGIGLPTAAIALMVIMIDPRNAIALVMMPMWISNVWQSIRAGDYHGAVKRYWLFALILTSAITCVVFFTRNVSDKGLLLAVSGAIFIFVAVSWRGTLPPIPDRFDKLAQGGFALFSGVIGGMTAAWGPGMAMYLSARQVDKDEFVRATGFLITIGSIPLIVSYWYLGFLTGEMWKWSMAMVIPTILGFSFGEYLRGKMSITAFRKFILLLFLVLALNMLRRAFFG